jgi:hypothetical protein
LKQYIIIEIKNRKGEMKMKTEKMEYLKEVVLGRIGEDYDNRKTSREIMNSTGLTFRELKEVIVELRKEYPICSTEINGGGYWMAKTSFEVLEFIEMIKRRRDGYNRTIDVMNDHAFEISR